MRRFLGLTVLCAGLGACTQFPQLDAAVSEEARRADYPSLLPAEQILAQRPEGRLTPDDAETLQARAERLRRRGEYLRRIAVVDDASRRRMEEFLRRHGR